MIAHYTKPGGLKMHETIFLTTHPFMDFILSHILSIILFSENGITLKHNLHLENKTHNINPVIALYTKGLPIQTADFSWQKYTSRQSPCYISTGYSIQLLAKTANFISKHPDIFKNPTLASAIQSELTNISSLQWDYCLENFKNNTYSIETYVSLLEACLSIAKLEDKQNHSLYNTIDIIYNKLSDDSILNSANTLELSRIANALYHFIQDIPNPQSVRETISKISLELVHRRNYLGLFQKDRFNRRTAPLSWQFHCIASLLLSYSIYPIDKIIDGAFSTFNQLYQLSWNPNLDLFSFSRKPYIRHTPFEITAIIKALSLLLIQVSNEEQYDRLYQILYNSYFPILSKEFFANYHTSIPAVYNNFLEKIQFPYNLKTTEFTKKIHVAPVFPNVIQIAHARDFSESSHSSKKLQIRWLNNSPIHLRYPLELCTQLIDYLETNHKDENENQHYEKNENMGLLDLLFTILQQSN